MACNLATAQTVPADSVRMILLPETGEIGFVIPRTAAIHYRNLVFDLVPALEEKIRLLEESSSQQSSLALNRMQQIENLEQQRLNLQRQIDRYEIDTVALERQLDEVNTARQREIRRKKFWRSSSLLFVGTTAAMTVALVVK